MIDLLFGKRRNLRVFIIPGGLLLLFLVSWLIGRLFLSQEAALILGGMLVLVATCANTLLWQNQSNITAKTQSQATIKPAELPAEPDFAAKTSLQLAYLFAKISQTRSVEDFALALVSDLRQSWQLTFSAFALYSEVDTLIRFDYVKFEGHEHAEPLFRKAAFHNLVEFNKPELVTNGDKEQTVILLKVILRDKSRGLLCLGPRENRQSFTTTDLELTAALSSIISTLLCYIVEVEELEEKVRQLESGQRKLQSSRDELSLINRDILTESEREMGRLSREIHQDPLIKIETLIGNFKEKFEKDHQSLNEAEHIAWKLAAEAERSLRAISRQLHPTALGEQGLAQILAGLVEDTMQKVRLVIKLKVSPEFDTLSLPAELETGLYRVVQGALDNVIDHSRAQHVTISLGVSEKSVRVAIVDDGIGFNMPSQIKLEDRQRFIGIASMQERLLTLGGKFKIRSSPGAGTVVEAEVPLPPDVDVVVSALPENEIEPMRAAAFRSA